MKKKYIGDREIEVVENIFVITPEQDIEKIPIACPVCDTLMKTKDDEEHWFKFSCCEWCANTWTYANYDKWKNGWRPEQSEITEKKKNRNGITVSFFKN